MLLNVSASFLWMTQNFIKQYLHLMINNCYKQTYFQVATGLKTGYCCSTFSNVNLYHTDLLNLFSTTKMRDSKGNFSSLSKDSEEKDLGIIFQENLKFDKQILESVGNEG